MSLNARQIKFVQEYLLSGNASDAARKAGYSEKSAGTHAERMLKNDEIQSAIKKIQEERKEKYNLSEEKILQALIDIAFFDPMEVLEQKKNSFVFKKQIAKDIMKGANFNIYPEYQTKDDKKQGIIRARLSVQSGDRKGALELLGQHIGMWGKNNVSNSDGSGDSGETAIQRIQRIVRERAERLGKKKSDNSEGES